MDTYDHIISFDGSIDAASKERMTMINEQKRNMGSFEERQNALENFRNALKPYIQIEKDKLELNPKLSILDNGHVLDHHVLGYFAPLNFQRKGFGAMLRTPVEQIVLLRNQLKEKGIRFIYAPLPCKLAIYPELVVDASLIPEDGCVIPQWRKMILEVLEAGVEVADCYEDFVKYKAEECLFSKNHHISPQGAEVIAFTIANYIRKTTLLPELQNNIELISREEIKKDYVLMRSGDYTSEKIGEEQFKTSCIYLKNEFNTEIYNGMQIESEICCIGNCNLQSYLNMGCDINSKLSYALNYPVKYGGRYLPFAKYDSIDKMPEDLLKNIKILIYVGFPSGSFVRAYHDDDVWSTMLIPNNVFG